MVAPPALAAARAEVGHEVRAIDRRAAGRLLKAIDEHVTKGVLSEALLPFYWRATALEPKMATRGPQDGPKMAPRGHQELPKLATRSLKMSLGALGS